MATIGITFTDGNIYPATGPVRGLLLRIRSGRISRSGRQLVGPVSLQAPFDEDGKFIWEPTPRGEVGRGYTGRGRCYWCGQPTARLFPCGRRKTPGGSGRWGGTGGTRT